MCTGRADFRSFGTYYDVTAVAALPYLDFALLEHFLSFDILQKCAVTLFVTLLDSSYEAELLSENVESFLVGGLCETVIHICPLVILSVCSLNKVVCGIADALELLEPELFVLLLVVCCVEENLSNLLETFLLCY